MTNRLILVYATIIIKRFTLFCVYVFRSKSPSSRGDGRHGDRRVSPQVDSIRSEKDRLPKGRGDSHHRDRRHRSRSLEHRPRDKPKKDIHRSHVRSRSRDHDRKRSRSPRDPLDQRSHERKRSDSKERHRHRHRSVSRERVRDYHHKHDSHESRHKKTGSHGSHRESSFDRDLKREKHRHSVKNGV